MAEEWTVRSGDGLFSWRVIAESPEAAVRTVLGAGYCFRGTRINLHAGIRRVAKMDVVSGIGFSAKVVPQPGVLSSAIARFNAMFLPGEER